MSSVTPSDRFGGGSSVTNYGTQVAVCPPGCAASGSIQGTNPFFWSVAFNAFGHVDRTAHLRGHAMMRRSSSICRAAIFEGLTTNEAGGAVNVTYLPPYAGWSGGTLTRNNITSSSGERACGGARRTLRTRRIGCVMSVDEQDTDTTHHLRLRPQARGGRARP